MLITAGQTGDGTWNLFGIDKSTGERLASVELPGTTTGYGMSSWAHDGRQYVMVQLPDGLAAMALPLLQLPLAGRIKSLDRIIGLPELYRFLYLYLI